MMHRRLLISLLLLAVSLPFASAEDETRPRWIVAYAPAHREALRPLVEARAAEGYEVVEIDVHAVLGPAHVRAGDGRPLRAEIQRLCGEAPGPCSVVLVGAPQGTDGADPAAVLPMLRGTVGRMRGRLTDNGYGCLDDDLVPDVAVGRLPARTSGEAAVMARKAVAAPGPKATRSDDARRRLTLLVGHPGGSSAIERRLASGIVRTALDGGMARVNPRWSIRALVHAPESDFCVPDADLPQRARDLVEEGQAYVLYLGHSGADGLWSAGTSFLERKDWSDLRMDGRGVFVTCGCYGCQVEGFGGEGHGFAAIRNPRGPVAVVGAHGESFGAMGKLAFEGLLPLLGRQDPPERVGEVYRAVKRGLAEGAMPPLTFWLYDRADGTGGAVPLATQRLEHLEMWTLLGDPATRLEPGPRDLPLTVEGRVAPTAALTVRGEVPAEWGTVEVEIVVERPFGSPLLSRLRLDDEEGPGRDSILRARFLLANDVHLLQTKTRASGGGFAHRIILPDALPWEQLVVRATVHAPEGSPRHGVAVTTQEEPR